MLNTHIDPTNNGPLETRATGCLLELFGLVYKVVIYCVSSQTAVLLYSNSQSNVSSVHVIVIYVQQLKHTVHSGDINADLNHIFIYITFISTS